MDIASRHHWAANFKAECESKGLQWIDESWMRPTGSTRGLLIGPKDAQQSKVIAFLHGLGNDALFPMLGLFRQLLSAGWSIATCDIDGHGIGNTSTLDAVHVTSCPDSLLEFISRHRPGRDRIHCAGFSFGAALMLNYATHNPERIHSLTIVGMPVTLTTNLPILTEASSVFRPTLLKSISEYGFVGLVPAFGPINRGKYPIRMTDGMNHLYISQGRSIIAQLKLAEALKVSTFPILVAGSERDFLGPLHPIMELQLPVEKLQVFKLKSETHFTLLFSPLVWKRMEIFLRTVRNYQ